MELEQAPQPSEAPKENVEVKEEVRSEDSDLSRRLAILSKKERSILDLKKQIEERKSYFDEIEKKNKEYEELLKLSKENPFEASERLGLDVRSLMEKRLEDDLSEDVEPRTLKKMIEEQRKEIQSIIDLNKKKDEEAQLQLEEQKKRQEEEDKQQYEMATKQYLDNADSIIKGSPEEYKILAKMGTEGLEYVWELVDKHFEQSGELLPPEKAAAKVEEALKGELDKMRDLFDNKTNAKAKSAMEEFIEQTNSKETATLSSDKLSSPSISDYATGYVDDEESKRRVAAYLDKALKSNG